MPKLGEIIRAARKAKGLSLDKLGVEVDYEKTNLSNIERGKLKPSDELLQKIATALEVSPDQLLALKIIDSTTKRVQNHLLEQLSRMKASGEL